MTDEGVRALLLKDVHLVELALSTGGRVLSMDKRSRDHFARLSIRLDRIRAILWASPEEHFEECLAWLVSGAPTVAEWTLLRRGQELEGRKN